ncbi:tubby-like protein 8 [Cinnamomum micranthum f. kanehirae]|uniref:Tubby-like protein 8 n=1 Tax=Cinnamomum micranthum f. kanehirae TaxID=337451 RepID=A0A3S3QCN6_9MAGN|nr:tubby-like protein 8 [Cinnamomum micranthum f. kanehirae]
MAGFKKSSSLSHKSSYKSLYVNPLNELKHNRSNSDGGTLGLHLCRNRAVCISGKENATPNHDSSLLKPKTLSERKASPSSLPLLQKRVLKPSSLQLCMQMNEPDSAFGSSLLGDDKSNPLNVWDFSDSEAAPASSWSTLPNRSLLCRPLPLDIGRCTCFIVKEASQELKGASLYCLYTNEGQGRQDRKLAVAQHRRRSGRSEFRIAQNVKGILCSSDESFLGSITANIMGSKHHIWDQGSPPDSLKKQSQLLLAVVMYATSLFLHNHKRLQYFHRNICSLVLSLFDRFTPTITTLTGSYRSMRAWIPKHQSMQLKNAAQIQHVNRLPKNWEEKMNKTHQLFSKVPHYNNISKRYELDFRERGKASGLRIQPSVKNFQLVMEEKGKQSILQFGRIGKSKYVMDYRFPMTAYQAFSICLASIDSKLCCSV